MAQEEQILFEYDFCELDLVTKVMLRKYTSLVKYVKTIRFSIPTPEGQMLMEETEEDFDF
jgi:hypothetical protein